MAIVNEAPLEGGSYEIAKSLIATDSKTGEEQSLRKVNETLIVDFNFLTVLRFL